jgi:hypothetical protein
MKPRHDGDCSIYSLLMNGTPEDGICTCGYGQQVRRERPGDISEMYSEELKKGMKEFDTRKINGEDIRKKLKDLGFIVEEAS